MVQNIGIKQKHDQNHKLNDFILFHIFFSIVFWFRSTGNGSKYRNKAKTNEKNWFVIVQNYLEIGK